MLDIHTLSWHYHWQPSEIKRLRVSERRDFVRMVEKQIEANNKANK